MSTSGTERRLVTGEHILHTQLMARSATMSPKTREEVRQKLARAIANRDGGLVFDAGNQTFGEYLERWLETSVRGSDRESTCESYRRQVRRYLVPIIGSVNLKKLSAMHV